MSYQSCLSEQEAKLGCGLVTVSTHVLCVNQGEGTIPGSAWETAAPPSMPVHWGETGWGGWEDQKGRGEGGGATQDSGLTAKNSAWQSDTGEHRPIFSWSMWLFCFLFIYKQHVPLLPPLQGVLLTQFECHGPLKAFLPCICDMCNENKGVFFKHIIY